MLKVLLTVIWLYPGGVYEKVELYTPTMELCKFYGEQILMGDGAHQVGCKVIKLEGEVI